MDHLTFEQLSSEAMRYDEAVLRTPGIDHFCSSSFWILPAAEHLMSPGGPWVRRSNSAYVALARHTNIGHGPNASVLHPLEAMWALPSPLVGAEPEELSQFLLEALGNDHDWGGDSNNQSHWISYRWCWYYFDRWRVEFNGWHGRDSHGGR